MTTPRYFSIICGLVLAAPPLFAQAAAATDRVSGAWTGYMRPSSAPEEDLSQRAITVELKLGSGSTLTGTVTGPPDPGVIRSGTFDPATGALTFDVTVDGEGSPFTFEGTVVRGTVTGRVSHGSERGVFMLTKAGAPSAPAGDTMTVGALRYGLREVGGWVSKSADLVPADKYSYRPTASVRTFGQQIAHVADSYIYYCGRAAGKNVQWSDGIEKGPTDKATLLPKLRQAYDACTATYGGTPMIGPAMANIAHTNLHYGNMITYMRMLGLTPPSS
jgi:hypothetical protein